MCYLDLLEDSNRSPSSSTPLPFFSVLFSFGCEFFCCCCFWFCFPSPKDYLQHLQNHPSLYEWQLDLSRGSLQRDRVALWGAMQPCEDLPYPAPHGSQAVDTARAQRGAISLLFSRDPWRNKRETKFCLSYNRTA